MSDLNQLKTKFKTPLVRRLLQWLIGGGSSIALLTAVVVFLKDVALDTINQVDDNQTTIIQLQQEINGLRREDELLWKTVSPTVQNYDKVNAQVGLLMDMYKQQHGVRPVVVLMNPKTGTVSSFQPSSKAANTKDAAVATDDVAGRKEFDEDQPSSKKIFKDLNDIEKAKHKKTPDQFREEMRIQQTIENKPPQAAGKQ